MTADASSSAAAGAPPASPSPNLISLASAGLPDDPRVCWIVERLAAGWLRLDPELAVRDIDSRWQVITGQPVDTAHGHGWIEAIDTSARIDFLDALRGGFATGTGVHGQLRLRHVDGSPRWIEIVGAPPTVDGAALNNDPIMLMQFRDITNDVEEHRRAEELTRVLESSTDFVMIMDPHHLSVRWANVATMRLFAPRTPLGLPLLDLLDSPSRDEFAQVATTALGHLSNWQGELNLSVPVDGADDRQIPVSALFAAHRNVDGAIESLSVVARDMSPLREAEQRVEASEVKLAALVEHASDIVCVIRPDGRVLYASPAIQTVLGHHPREVEGLPILSYVHIDDALTARNAVDEVLGHPHTSQSFDIRVQHADESWRHLAVVATNLLDNSAVNGVVLNARDVTDRVNAAASLRARAYHDDLTGLPNRALLLERLADSLLRAGGRNRLVGVLFLDLDRFKIVNDSLGHSAGDDLLREVARRIRETVRPDDTVARLGGDEFVVVMNDMAKRSDAAHAARRLRKAISDPITLGRDVTVVTASIGINVAQGTSNPADLLRDADTALYRAKARGRDRAHVFDDNLRDQAVRRLSVEQELRRALDSNDFAIYYQPLVRIHDERIIGAEALVRMRSSTQELLLPGTFIEVAEDAGLITQLGATVFANVCKEVSGWSEQLLSLSVGVNVSARQLNDSNFAPFILDELNKAGVTPSRIYLELTEGSLIESSRQTERTLRNLHEAGIGLALDDFGTGFSSLAYLKRFPIDVLKIDRSFIDGLGSEEHDTAIVKATIALAHSLGIRVVAEGVETADQLAWLRKLDCDSVQGYLFGRPMPAPQFVAAVTKP